MPDASRAREFLDQVDQTYGILGDFEGDKSTEYPIENRLNVRLKEDDWAVTIERLVYVPIAVRYQKSVHAGIRTWVFFWGNCLRPAWKQLLKPVILNPTRDTPDGRSFLRDPDGPHPHVNPAVAAIVARGKRMSLEMDRHNYAEQGITLTDPTYIRPFECLRALPLAYRRMLLAEDAEIVHRFRKGRMPPVVLSLDEWRNPLYQELPSKLESMQMLAEVIATGDIARYDPRELPNTHWSNWPQAGTWHTEYGPDIVPPSSF